MSSRLWLRLFSAAVAILHWTIVIGFIDLPPYSPLNARWSPPAMLAAGAVAAVVKRPIGKTLLSIHLGSLVVWWIFRDGFV
jgi:hypothetical protein